MIVYFSTLAAVSLLLMLYSSRKLSGRSKAVCYFLITAVLLFVAGFRYYVGTDYGQYVRNYEMYLYSELSLLSQPALAIVAKIAAFLYDDYATWFFLMSAITILPVMKTISRESTCLWLSVILYLFLCCWHFPFNIVKQGAAATVIFAGYPFLRDRKLGKWSVACVLASLFHVTAVLMIPVFFLVNAEINRKRTLLMIAIGIITLFSYDRLFDVVAILKRGEGLIKQTSDTWRNGVNILRISVHCVPVVVYAVFRKRYNKDAAFSSLYNMSLLNAMLNIGSMNSIYLNRFCSYTNIFNILFIPMLFQPIKRKRTTFWILPLALAFYFVFWTYDLYKGSSTVNFQWIFAR